MQATRVIMMGTGPFAVPTLRQLHASPAVIVVAVVTRPARKHKPGAPQSSPMKEAALGLHLPVFEPESINTDEARAMLKSFAPDVLVVCDYGQILSTNTLAVASLGGINLHASLLPKYRGAAPINWAIYHGETTTGVTVIHMTPTIDAGPAIAALEVAIGPEETAAELEPRLAELGAPLVEKALAALVAGTARPIAQDSQAATPAPRLKKTDGAVDWSRPARAIANQVRAMQPWPKTYTSWARPNGEPLRLILECVAVVPPASGAASDTAPPGTVLEAAGERLVIAAGADALAIERIQPAGKRVLTAGEFLRGYRLPVGEQLSNPG